MTLVENLNALFDSYGYRRYALSKFEEYDLYARNRDFLQTSQIITFNDLDGKLLALKPDITLSILHSSKGKDEKVYYNENVYRPKNHHYREIPQAGIECIGTIDPYKEAEVLAMAVEALHCISLKSRLRISDLAYLDAVFQEEKISDSSRKEVLQALSSKSMDQIDLLKKEKKLTEQAAEHFKKLIGIYAPLKQGIEQAESISNKKESREMLQHMKQLCSLLEIFGYAENIYLDFSLVNSMDYYNGIIFQGAVEEIPETILSGGRYDRLAEKISSNTGAIGFAVYLDAIRNHEHKHNTYDGDLLITYSDKDNPADIAYAMKAMHAEGKHACMCREGSGTDSSRYRKHMRLQEALREVKK